VAGNVFDQFDAPKTEVGAAPKQGNVFDQFDPSAAAPSVPTAAAPSREMLPGPRQSYSVGEIPGAALRNLPASAKKFGTELYEAVTSPVQTAKGMWDVATGALINALPEEVVSFINKFDANPAATRRAIELANSAGGMLKDRYGSVDNIKRTLAEDPVGAAADLSTLLSGGAMATTRAAPGVSATLSRAATMTDPLSVVTKPAQTIIAAKQAVMPPPVKIQEELNAVRDANLRAAQEAGYVVTPGSVSSTGKNIIAERMAGKTNIEQLASIQNQEVTNKLIRKDLNLPETAPLTAEKMREVRQQEFTKGYEPVKKLGRIAVDDAYLDEVAAIEAKHVGQSASFPEAAPPKVKELIDKHLVNNFDSSDALQRISSLRDDAKAAFKRGENDLAFANTAIANALENQIERSLELAKRPDAPKLLENFRNSRRQIAISHTVEDAIREGTGNVSGTKLARDLQSGKYVSGNIRLAAEFANAFPRVSQLPSQIGTPGAGTILGRSMTGAGAGIGGALGYMGGADAIGTSMAAATGAMVPEMISAGMRNYLLSQRGQRNVIPSYQTIPERVVSDAAARNALRLYQMQMYGQPENQNSLAR